MSKILSIVEKLEDFVSVTMKEHALKRLQCTILLLFLCLLSLLGTCSLSVASHGYFQVYSAEVSRNIIEPLQNLTFSGIIYYNETLTPPFSGNASLNFDGIDDFVSVANSPIFNITDRISISCWIRTDKIGAFQRVLWKHEAFGLTINPSGKIYGTIWIADSSQDSFSSVTNVADSSWHLCTYVYDGQEHRIYIDGVLESIRNQTGVIRTSVNDLFIGKQEDNLYPFEGLIDDIRIYNCSLETSEIFKVFTGTFENETAMIAHWNFDGDTLDTSGNGNNGVVYGTTWANGWACIRVYLGLNGSLKKTVDLVNSTDGNFDFPWITGESEPGVYDYMIYVENGAKNQTVTVIVMPPTPPEIVILSPRNTTYAADSVPLTFTINKSTSWIGYSLDNNSNVTVNTNTTLQGLSTRMHSITVYANSTFGKMGSSETIDFVVDAVHPSIINVYRMPEGNVTPDQSIKISANVTDTGSGVHEVILSYSLDNGISWNNRTMNYNATTNMYEQAFQPLPLGTYVKYMIIALDNANNSVIDDNSGQFYSYTVISEFPFVALALLIFMLLTIVILIAKHKLKITSKAESSNRLSALERISREEDDSHDCLH